MNCAVLFREAPLDRFDTLAPQVRQAYGLTDYDARMKLRRGWGFLERDCPRAEADRLVAAVAGCVIMDQLREPADPQVIRGLEFDATTFTPEGARRIEWNDLLIVAVGAITEEVIRRDAGGKDVNAGQMLIGLGMFAVTGLPFGLIGGKKEEKKPVKSNRLVVFARLVTRYGEHFALNLDQFNFAGLGALKQLQGLANLRVFCGELQQRSPARLNCGARLLLGNQPLASANYGSVADFETELLWLFNIP